MKAIKIDSLTSVRFFAAAMVVVLHTRHNFGYFGVTSHLSLTQAVSLFFVLSGYILAHTHRSIGSASELVTFYCKRFARIWPLHIAGACFAAWLIHYEGGSINGYAAAINVSLLHAWSPNIDTYFSLNGVSWSLSDEAFFYVIFPVLIWRIRTTYWIKLSATIAATALMLLAFRDMGRPLMLWSAYISPVTRLAEFMLGIAAYQWRDSMKRAVGTGLRATAMEVSVVLLAAVAVWMTDLHYVSDSPLHPIKPVAIYLSNCGAGIFFAALISVFAIEQGYLTKALRARPLVYLGEISFALYVVHQLVQRYLEDHGYVEHDLPIAIQALIYWLAAIATAAIVHHLIERPAQRAIMALVQPRRSAMPSPDAS